MKERKAFDKELVKQAKKYIAADVRLFASCQDEQEAAGIANVNKLISFVNPETEGGAGTSLLLQILYHRHKLKKEIKAKFDKRIADNEAREIQKKKEEEEKLKKKLEELRLKYGDREDSSDSDSSGWSSDEEKKKKQTVEYPKLTYSQILQHMLEACQRNEYNQIPMLTSSRPIDLENDGFDVIPDNFKGTKRALLIGINYTDQPIALTSCHNDCNNAVKYLKNCHDFEEKNVTMLLDDGIHMEPTKKNILTTFQKFAFSCRPGDVVFFHFSGHGTKVEDTSGDESDGFDQAMLPVDYFDHGEVIDDDIFRVLLIPMPKGVTVTAVVDCCHSGTIFDLPFEYDAVTKKNSDYSKVRFPHMKVVDEFRNKMRALKAEQPNTKELAETKSKPSEERGRASKQTTKIQKRKSRSLEPALSLARRSKSPKQDEKHKAPSPTKKREIEKESLKNSVVTAAAPTSTKPSPRVAAKSPKTSKTKPGRAKSPKRGASPKRNTEWKSPFEM